MVHIHEIVFQVFPSISLTWCFKLMINKDNPNGSTQHKHRPHSTRRLGFSTLDLVLYTTYSVYTACQDDVTLLSRYTTYPFISLWLDFAQHQLHHWLWMKHLAKKFNVYPHVYIVRTMCRNWPRKVLIPSKGRVELTGIFCSTFFFSMWDF